MPQVFNSSPGKTHPNLLHDICSFLLFLYFFPFFLLSEIFWYFHFSIFDVLLCKCKISGTKWGVYSCILISSPFGIIFTKLMVILGYHAVVISEFRPSCDFLILQFRPSWGFFTPIIVIFEFQVILAEFSAIYMS